MSLGALSSLIRAPELLVPGRQRRFQYGKRYDFDGGHTLGRGFVATYPMIGRGQELVGYGPGAITQGLTWNNIDGTYWDNSEGRDSILFDDDQSRWIGFNKRHAGLAGPELTIAAWIKVIDDFGSMSANGIFYRGTHGNNVGTVYQT